MFGRDADSRIRQDSRGKLVKVTLVCGPNFGQSSCTFDDDKDLVGRTSTSSLSPLLRGDLPVVSDDERDVRLGPAILRLALCRYEDY